MSGLDSSRHCGLISSHQLFQDVHGSHRGKLFIHQSLLHQLNSRCIRSVQHIGRISHISPSPTYELTISDCASILADCSIGDSISVNGACLTATEFDAKEGWFKVGLGVSFREQEAGNGSDTLLVDSP